MLIWIFHKYYINKEKHNCLPFLSLCLSIFISSSPPPPPPLLLACTSPVAHHGSIVLFEFFAKPQIVLHLSSGQWRRWGWGWRGRAAQLSSALLWFDIHLLGMVQSLGLRLSAGLCSSVNCCKCIAGTLCFRKLGVWHGHRQTPACVRHLCRVSARAGLL